MDDEQPTPSDSEDDVDHEVEGGAASSQEDDVVVRFDTSGLFEPGIPIIERNWLNIDPNFMQPKKMCAVNQFVHIVSELDDPYISTSSELVLLGTGSSLPEHFRWMIYCIEMVRFISGLLPLCLTVFFTDKSPSFDQRILHSNPGDHTGAQGGHRQTDGEM